MKKKPFLLDRNVPVLAKIKVVLAIFIRLTLFVAVGFAVYERNWAALFVTILTLILTFIPEIFEKRYRIDIPEELEIIIILFIYASLFLGTVRGYYTWFWWWDAALHTGSGVALGFIGFVILYVLYRQDKVEARPGIIVLFAFCFAVALGAVWEIFEFGLDQFFPWNMQESGLMDTMGDLIVDSIGALFASVIGYVYLKGGEKFVLRGMMRRFIKRNRQLFRD